jgi:uncharacterized membrane protein YphA (DoxX/SURF4 family)/thiol-disulfide isomerase/thioredoxin
MDLVLLASRLVLAFVFLLAAVAKLFDLPGTRQALVDFGLPERPARAVAPALPLAELAVAGALVPSATARAGAAAALAMLVLFSAAVAFNLGRGRKPDCHCFGQLHSSPVGAVTLGRNAALAALAALVAWRGSGSPSWLGELRGAEVAGLVAGLVLFGLVVVEGWFILALTRQQGRLLLRLDAIEGRGEQPGLPLGTPAPPFEALAAAGLPLMVVFTAGDCRPCKALLPEIARWQHDYREVARIAVISEDEAVEEAYRIDATPSAVLVGADGRIASPVAPGADAIRRLMLRASAPLAPATNGQGRRQA